MLHFPSMYVFCTKDPGELRLVASNVAAFAKPNDKNVTESLKHGLPTTPSS
jgi:hypothetical protein